jgi:hypothetical protein
MKKFLTALIFCFALSAYAWEPIALDAAGYEWMDTIVAREFAAFEESGITQSLLEKTWIRVKEGEEFLRYRVISSEVYGPEGFVKNLLLSLVRHYPVPDVDFIYYFQDILREDFFKKMPNLAPIFVGARNCTHNRVILFSDCYYDILANSGWNELIDAINEQWTLYPWTSKSNTLFWRGSNTDGHYSRKNWHQYPRGSIVLLSRRLKSQEIDAAFTQFLPDFTKHYKEFTRCMYPSPYVPVVDHLKFKYQLLVDGVTCTYPGTHWRLLSGCTSMKQESSDILWFFSELIPWYHYIPFKRDLSDALEKVHWAQEHDQEAEKIALQAREFALTHLMPEHILLYCYKALVKYASLQKFSPTAPEPPPCKSGCRLRRG